MPPRLLSPAGVLAPLTRLRSLELKWYTSADLQRLLPSVHSVALHLPGDAFSSSWIAEALQAGALEGEVLQQLAWMLEQLGAVNPLASVSGVSAAAGCLQVLAAV